MLHSVLALVEHCIFVCFLDDVLVLQSISIHLDLLGITLYRRTWLHLPDTQ